MLSEEEKQVVHYLRESPSDSLKRDAADIIEGLDAAVDSLTKAYNIMFFGNIKKQREIDEILFDLSLEKNINHLRKFRAEN